MATDFPSTFKEKSMMKMVGYDMAKHARERLFDKTGERVENVDVVELHDCFSANELITYEALGLCEEGKVLTLIYFYFRIQIIFVEFMTYQICFHSLLNRLASLSTEETIHMVVNTLSILLEV